VEVVEVVAQAYYLRLLVGQVVARIVMLLVGRQELLDKVMLVVLHQEVVQLVEVVVVVLEASVKVFLGLQVAMVVQALLLQ
jgi:hypothetical protein